MKKRQHKYFRNLRYKQKLESRYNNRDYSWCRVGFITKEPDPRYIRENMFRYIERYFYLKKYNNMTYDEFVNMRLEEFNNDKKIGHDFYEYYDRPEVPYSIIEHTDRLYGKSKKFYKKYTTRVIRHSKDALQHNQYKKMFDLWWAID